MAKVRQLLISMSRFLFVLLLLLLVFGFAMFEGGVVSWTILYTTSPFILYSIGLFLYPLRDLTGKRMIRKLSIQNGEKLNVKLVLSRKFQFPILYTVVEEKWRNNTLLKKTGEVKKIGVLGFRKSLEWDYEIEGMLRGEHRIEGVTIEVTDFFGWIRKTYFIPIEDTVLVYPQMMNIDYVPIGAQYDQGSIITPYSIIKDATMATGVRDYQPGDRVSWIHWKSFARTQTLMTKEFEDRKSQDPLLVFDRRPSDTFEDQVEFAASILQGASEQHMGIGFLTTGFKQDFFPPAQSEAQFRKVLVHLAKIMPVEEHSKEISANYRTVFGQSGRILVVTGNPDWVFLESIIANIANARAIICFVVVEKSSSPSGKLEEDIQFAKSKGIAVHKLARKQFPMAFREGPIHE